MLIYLVLKHQICNHFKRTKMKELKYMCDRVCTYFVWYVYRLYPHLSKFQAPAPFSKVLLYQLCIRCCFEVDILSWLTVALSIEGLCAWFNVLSSLVLTQWVSPSTQLCADGLYTCSYRNCWNSASTHRATREYTNYLPSPDVETSGPKQCI